MGAMNKLPPVPEMFRAFVERDSSFEGVFYTGVRTTGIFCRPTCTAKKPRPENVEFFASGSDALYAGYRPCLRCKPLDHGRPSALVEKLRGAVEEAPAGKLTDENLRTMGIDPSTARRQFQRHFGMTFHAYHRARRMGLALQKVRQGESVIDAQLDQGFESGSGFREAFAKVFGQAPKHASKAECLLARWIDTPLGAMLALANDAGLQLLEFTDRRGLEREIALLRKHTDSAVVPGSHAHLSNIARQLEEYFAGKRSEFSVPLEMHGSDFQKKVWNELLRIPPGKTRSYSEMAARIGVPQAVRAIGRANGSNPLCIVVPCHRVIRADGTLCGYGGGIWRKQWLLDHESKTRSSAH
jgi:AraC family transcriptional regulator, regulatory protein of adaptative response / methylated-DNA-[protein]-cysteine methyltransferase